MKLPDGAMGTRMVDADSVVAAAHGELSGRQDGR